MRNFWINTRIDGRNTELSSGPRSDDGCMTTRLFVKAGGSEEVVRIECFPTKDADSGEDMLRVHFAFSDGTYKNISVVKSEIKYE